MEISTVFSPYDKIPLPPVAKIKIKHRHVGIQVMTYLG